MEGLVRISHSVSDDVSSLGHPGEPSSGQFRRVPSRPDAPGLETALLRAPSLCLFVLCLRLPFRYRVFGGVVLFFAWMFPCVGVGGFMLRVPQVFASLPSRKPQSRGSQRVGEGELHGKGSRRVGSTRRVARGMRPCRVYAATHHTQPAHAPRCPRAYPRWKGEVEVWRIPVPAAASASWQTCTGAAPGAFR